MILCIETATNLCSAALCDNAGVVALKESNDSKTHASMLTVFIQDILRNTGIRTTDLEAIAVSKGPGSFTGLRIGVSVAKGIAYASSIPLIGIETTLSMFHGFIGANTGKALKNCETLYCPMLDARRMEVYYAIYDCEGNIVSKITAEIINEDSFRDIPESYKIIFFGDGAGKLNNVIKRPEIYFDEEFRISASHMIKPAYDAFNNNRFDDVAYFEPFYLKDFIATNPRKNLPGR